MVRKVLSENTSRGLSILLRIVSISPDSTSKIAPDALVVLAIAAATASLAISNSLKIILIVDVSVE